MACNRPGIVGFLPVARFSFMPDPLIHRLKELIITTLNLEDRSPADIDENAPLINSGLALDSIDALELVVKIEKEIGIKISNSEESRTAFTSVASLAGFVRARADAARLDAFLKKS